MTTSKRSPIERRRPATLEKTPHAHQHPDRQIVCHVLEGRLELSFGSDVREVGGDVIRFDGEQDISPHAQADTTALLVLAPRADD